MSKTESSLSEIAKRLGCDVRSVRRYRAQGAPLDDPVALNEWLAGIRGTDKGVPTTLNDAKLKKLQLECDKLIRLNDEAAGRLVDRKDVAADIRRIASAMQSRLAILPGEAPSWAGLEPHEIQSKAKDFVRQTYEAFHELTSTAYQ